MLSHLLFLRQTEFVSCWEGRAKKPKADGCWAHARTEVYSSTGFKLSGFGKGQFPCLYMVCMSLLIGEVEYIEGQSWEYRGQGSLYWEKG